MIVIVVHLETTVIMIAMMTERTPATILREAFTGEDVGIVGTNANLCRTEITSKQVGARVVEVVVGHTVQMADRTGDTHHRLQVLDLDIMMIILRHILPAAILARTSLAAICDLLLLTDPLLLVPFRTNYPIFLLSHLRPPMTQKQSSRLRLRVMI